MKAEMAKESEKLNGKLDAIVEKLYNLDISLQKDKKDLEKLSGKIDKVE